MLGIASLKISSLIIAAVSAGNLRGNSSQTCSGASAAVPLDRRLYRLPGQPDLANSVHRKCPAATCSASTRIKPGLFSVNDGPTPYDLPLPLDSPTPLSAEKMGEIYREKIGFQGVRNDESGLAFDIRCMFPDPEKDPENDSNWNWNKSDELFNATVAAGLAPLLKIPVFEWNSPRITGLSYVDNNGEPVYVVPPQPFAECPAWPAYAPIIRKIGSKLALKIVDRYNKNGMLNATSWAKGFAGVELMNEWGALRCGPSKDMPTADAFEAKQAAKPHLDALAVEWEVFTEQCDGEPYTWRNHYWDGTPQQAWDFYVEASKLIKRRHPGVQVGGPAALAEPTWFTPAWGARGVYGGLGKWWVDNFLQTVKHADAPLNFFSWHQYTNDANMSDWYEGFKHSLQDAGFSNTSMALTEYNAMFLPEDNKSKYVTTLAGAAVNLGKLAMMMQWPDMEAAFVLDGRVGAYTPRNPFTFPLDCQAATAHVIMGDCGVNGSCRPKSTVGQINLFDDVWTDCCRPESVTVPNEMWTDCSTADMWSLEGVTACEGEGKCEFGPANTGMGIIYVDGTLTPYAVALSMLKHSQGRRRLELVEKVVARFKSANVSIIAWQSSEDSSIASVLLTNEERYNTGPLPPARALFPGSSTAGVVGASRLTQREAGSPDGDNIDGFSGLSSMVRLTGHIEDAASAYCGNGQSGHLPSLGPFETVLLAISYEGCLCDWA